MICLPFALLNVCSLIMSGLERGIGITFLVSSDISLVLGCQINQINSISFLSIIMIRKKKSNLKMEQNGLIR